MRVHFPYRKFACFWNFTEVSSIDPSNKHQNAWDKYPIMHHFVTEMCTHVHISATKCCIVEYGTGAFWDLGDGSIDTNSALVQVMD